jgi:prefoldin subunit 5
MTIKTPEQIANEVFDAQWNAMTARQLMIAAIEKDREQTIAAIEDHKEEKRSDATMFVNAGLFLAQSIIRGER